MITSTALHLASRHPGSTGAPSPVPVLASRPGGVLHVVEVPNPDARVIPPTCAPVCGRRYRRLYLVPDQSHPRLVGHHLNGQRMCFRCSAHLARASRDRAGWATNLIDHAKIHRTDHLTTSTAGGEPFEVTVADRTLGVIACAAGRWHVHSAGPGVTVDRSLRVPTSDEAVVVLAIARERAALPGGALDDIDGLTIFDRTVLDFAARTYQLVTLDGRRNGRRDAHIRAELGLTANFFTQHLNALIDEPAALRYAPATVTRLRRLRTKHQMQRRHPQFHIPAGGVYARTV